MFNLYRPLLCCLIFYSALFGSNNVIKRTDALLPQQGLVSDDQELYLVLYRMRDDLRAELLKLINAETRSIDVAMFTFTDKFIADALIAAHKRGVVVRVALDRYSMGESAGSKGPYLQNNGITVHPFMPQKIKDNPALSNTYPLLHDKFLIFGRNAAYKNKSLVWTGSYNLTDSASLLNYENAIVLDNNNAVNQYKQCFETIVQVIEKYNSVPAYQMTQVLQEPLKNYATVTGPYVEGL